MRPSSAPNCHGGADEFHAPASAEPSPELVGAPGPQDFGDPRFWEAEYTAEPADATDTDDWLVGWAELGWLLEPLLGRDHARSVLHLGCGLSALGEELYDRGYLHQTSVDISQSAISRMAARNQQRRPKMRWLCGDACGLGALLDSGSYHMVIEKSTLDALFCHDHHALAVTRMLREACRLMTDSGVFVSVSMHGPLQVLPWLRQQAFGWRVRVVPLPDSSSAPRPELRGRQAAHHAYVCSRRRSFACCSGEWEALLLRVECCPDSDLSDPGSPGGSSGSSPGADTDHSVSSSAAQGRLGWRRPLAVSAALLFGAALSLLLCLLRPLSHDASARATAAGATEPLLQYPDAEGLRDVGVPHAPAVPAPAPLRALQSNRWTLVSASQGCANWQDILIGSRSFEQFSSACGTRCRETQGCVAFNYQPTADCRGDRSEKGACLLFSGDCAQSWNDCWEFYAKSADSSTPVVTSLAYPSKATATYIEVESAKGFGVGANIRLSDSEKEEVSHIKNVRMGGLVLINPLRHSYGIGTVVSTA